MAETLLAQRLKETHPTYNEMQADWEFYLDSYAGGNQYRQKSYLFHHERETPKNYADRKKRAVFPNYSRKTVDIYSAFIFKDPINRSCDEPDFADFERDADGKGTPLSQLMADQVGKQGMVTGHAVALVDMPSNTAEAQTRLDDTILGIRPYVTVYSPPDVVDWAIDADGSYRWIRFRETATDESDPFSSRSKTKRIYRTWTRDTFTVHDDAGLLIEEGTHGLGEVPAVLIPIREHMTYMDVGESLLTDIAMLNRAIYNYRSLLDEFLYRQCFNFLALATDESLTPERIKALMQEYGINNATFYPAKAGPPSYVSPPSDPAEMIMKAIDMAAREIVELAKLQDRKSSSSEKSGIAHAYEFQESNAAFAKIAKNLEDGERKIIRLYYKWQKKDDVTVSIEYPSDFNITTLADQIEEGLSALSMNISDTFNAELKKRMVSVILPDLDPETEDTIEEEIDSTPSTSSELLTLRSAGVKLQGTEGTLSESLAVGTQPAQPVVAAPPTPPMPMPR